jgi:hypothetical protein
VLERYRTAGRLRVRPGRKIKTVRTRKPGLHRTGIQETEDKGQ